MDRLKRIQGKSTIHSVYHGKAVVVVTVIRTESMKTHHLYKKLRSVFKKIMDK